MELLHKLSAWLDGKKTYLAGGAMVLGGLAEQDWQVVLEGLSIIFLRKGIEKV